MMLLAKVMLLSMFGFNAVRLIWSFCAEKKLSEISKTNENKIDLFIVL